MKIPLRKALWLAVGPANVDAAGHAVADWFDGHNCSGAADLIREHLQDQPVPDAVPHNRPDTSLRAELMAKLATQREVLLSICDRVDRLEMRADGLTPIKRVQRRWATEADGPAAQSRQPAVVGQPTDAELLELYPLSMTDLDDAFAFARAVLARWGRQPAPPAEGEVGDLVNRLRRASDGASAMGWEQDAWTIARAAELLQQQEAEVQRLRAQQTPVPVSEEPWKREGWCDESGLCWFGWATEPYLPPYACWSFCKPSERECNPVSLPATALPLPAGEGQTTPSNHPTNDE